MTDILNGLDAKRSVAPHSAESGVRTRGIILNVAERLFANRGFDGVSMRQIAIEAKVPLALVAYHFKSKVGLYRAVFCAHEAILNERVAKLKRFSPSPNQEKTVRDLMFILIDPIIEMATAPGGRDFARLIAREANDPMEAERGIFAEFIDPVAKLIIAQLQMAFPEVDKATVHWAFLFASGALAINHAATGRIERLSEGLCRSEERSEIIESLVDFTTGGILSTFAAQKLAGSRGRNIS